MSSPHSPLLLRLRKGQLLRLNQGGLLSQALQFSLVGVFLRWLFPTLYQMSWVTGGTWPRSLMDHQIRFTSFLDTQLCFTFQFPLQFSTSLGMSTGQWCVRQCAPPPTLTTEMSQVGLRLSSLPISRCWDTGRPCAEHGKARPPGPLSDCVEQNPSPTTWACVRARGAFTHAHTCPRGCFTSD